MYRSTIGALKYLTLSRPDIAFSVKKLSQFLQAPTQNQWKACERILRYLVGTIGEGIWFTPALSTTIESLSDSDWASSLDDRKSTTGYCVYFGGNLFSLSSRKHKSVARSSTVAEYRALAQACTEVVWLQSLFTKIGIKSACPTVIWCENSRARQLASNSVFHSRTKHIEIDVHFTIDKVLDKEIEVRYIPSSEHTSHILTKSLSITSFHHLKNKLPISHSPLHSLRGRVEMKYEDVAQMQNYTDVDEEDD
ncbi:secreted RxLR effector protein 161-like [Humulus lupulus]|uniref:secreted RxLR effector protein 161-like n=1 Tax=Humulus lupulus TaxID=3486 RepID=UPI002B4174B5|nr:secreted RxLR effector protein 161-like [Humulus lupulus]